jgi:proteasome lid subunit RPN8/RPN11
MTRVVVDPDGSRWSERDKGGGVVERTLVSGGSDLYRVSTPDGCVSITDHIRGLELLPGLRAALVTVLRSRVERDRELAIRRRRMDELNRSKPVPVHPLLPTTPKAKPAEKPSSPLDGPPIDFRPHARPRHVLRFDGRGQVLDQTLTTIRDYVQTAGPVGVETGGFLWGPERPTGAGTTITRVSGPAPDSKHEERMIVLGDPGKVEGGALRANLIPLGDFHSHPGITRGWPSSTDRETWVESLRLSRLPSYVSIIVCRSHPLVAWGGADMRAWVTHRESATGRYVIEPATIEREG